MVRELGKEPSKLAPSKGVLKVGMTSCNTKNTTSIESKIADDYTTVILIQREEQ